MALPPQNRHYPSRAITGPLHDDFRILYDHVYSLTDKLKETTKQLEDMKQAHGTLAKQVANGPSNTKIMGIPVQATPPADGQTLKYSAAQGIFLFE
jgi:hypothetical protein